jgi:hypothetical protein
MKFQFRSPSCRRIAEAIRVPLPEVAFERFLGGQESSGAKECRDEDCEGVPFHLFVFGFIFGLIRCGKHWPLATSFGVAIQPVQDSHFIPATNKRPPGGQESSPERSGPRFSGEESYDFLSGTQGWIPLYRK